MHINKNKKRGVGCYNQPMNYSTCGTANGAYSWIYNTNKMENSSSYQWTWLLSPRSNDVKYVFDVVEVGMGNTSASDNGVARPVVYLKSSVEIFDGDGSINNPYWLSNS